MEIEKQRVMIFGTFDVFHPGHEYFISEAMKKGTELIVVVARDKTVRQLKPLLRNSEDLRKQVLEDAFPDVSVVLGDEEDYMAVVREYSPSLICLGYDQQSFDEELVNQFPDIEILRLDSFEPDKYKSSLF